MIRRQRKTKPALWTTVPGAAAVRAPAKAARQRKPRKRLRPQSRKRQKEARTYARERLEFLAARPRCERCGAPATCVHHWAGRRSNYLKRETWRASCSECNDFAKRDPAGARLENWIAPVGQYLT